MMNLLPAPALHFFEGRTGEVIPALVVPEDVAGGVGHPRELRDRVGERVEVELRPDLELRGGPVLPDSRLGLGHTQC